VRPKSHIALQGHPSRRTALAEGQRWLEAQCRSVLQLHLPLIPMKIHEEVIS
jgi:hypothetical protein